jgi:hypothetical protein
LTKLHVNPCFWHFKLDQFSPNYFWNPTSLRLRSTHHFTFYWYIPFIWSTLLSFNNLTELSSAFIFYFYLSIVFFFFLLDSWELAVVIFYIYNVKLWIFFYTLEHFPFTIQKIQPDKQRIFTLQKLQPDTQRIVDSPSSDERKIMIIKI